MNFHNSFSERFFLLRTFQDIFVCVHVAQIIRILLPLRTTTQYTFGFGGSRVLFLFGISSFLTQFNPSPLSTSEIPMFFFVLMKY